MPAKQSSGRPERLLRVSVDGIGSELQGVGRAADGRVVFIPGALPGETVRCAVRREAKNFIEAALEDIEEASPARVQPPCALYGECGGCVAQHMTYETALLLKRRAVEQALCRIGGLEAPEVRPAKGMASPWHYRNKAEYAIGEEGGRLVVGFRAAKSHRVIPAEACLLQDAQSLRALKVFQGWLDGHRFSAWNEATRRGQLRHLVTRVNDAGACMVVVCGEASLPHLPDLAARYAREMPEVASLYHLIPAPNAAHALDGECRRIAGDATLSDHLLGLSFELSPTSFFQVNRAQTEVLYSAALEAAALTGEETVLDAYCGVGTISLAMARAAKRVIGIELAAPAVENARENAARNGLAARCQFLCGDAPQTLNRLVRQGVSPDVVAVDPPRKGLTPVVIDAIRKAGPKRVVYVSCNPATLARDVKLLVEGGAYAFRYAQPVDMFCQTEHVETVALLSTKM